MAVTDVTLSDRQDFRQLEEVPTLAELIDADSPGVVLVKQGELLTGFQRQLYMSGFTVIELDGDMAQARAFQMVTPGA